MANEITGLALISNAVQGQVGSSMTPASGQPTGPLGAGVRSVAPLKPPSGQGGDFHSVEDAMHFFSELVRRSGREVSIRAGNGPGRYVVAVFDSSGSLLRQIPSEEMIALASKIQSDGVIRFLDKRV